MGPVAMLLITAGICHSRMLGWQPGSLCQSCVGLSGFQSLCLALCGHWRLRPSLCCSRLVAFFSFLGLLIGVNLIMSGLTYNKVNKIQTQLKRRG